MAQIISIDSSILENVVKYCENQAIYDKLGCYGDFYYKIKNLLKKDEPIIVEDNRQTFINVTKWLDGTDFGSDVMNQLAHEITTAMCSIYRYGCEYWDPEVGTEVVFEVDQENPNVKELLDFSINSIKQDFNLLKDYGIAIKKATKKCPYTINDIDWSAFNIFNK